MDLYEDVGKDGMQACDQVGLGSGAEAKGNQNLGRHHNQLVLHPMAPPQPALTSCAYDPSLAKTTLSASRIVSFSSGASSPPKPRLEEEEPLMRSSYEPNPAAGTSAVLLDDDDDVVDVEKLPKDEMRLCSRSTSSRWPSPYSIVRSAARMRGLLSVNRRRER